MASSEAPQLRPTQSFRRVLTTLRTWWRSAVMGTVDQAEVIHTRRAECEMSARYLFMLAMSASIAILGLLLSSPAVVIGAMLLSPLMDPIMGLGFALATGDYSWMKKAAKSLAIGTILSILLCAVIVFLSPLQTVTSEIAARTRPNLFDLGVAFFSALAGAYAMIRGRMGTVVGVAIATALMPPLAVVGFGLATWNGAVFWGALGLYVTNLLTIALTAAVMARFYGFRTSLSDRQTQFQTIVIVVVFVALAIPLGLSLWQIAWEARSTQKIRSELTDVFDNRSVISNIKVNWEADPIRIDATVFTPELRPEAEAQAARAIAREIGKPVSMTIVQARVGQDRDAAEAAQLAAARAREEAADLRQTEELATRLALVAGVTEREVTLDRDKRQAFVTARPLPGATLAAYRELEERIIRTAPEWTVYLRPPARALPEIAFTDEGKPTDNGDAAMDLVVWAAKRIEVPIILSGPEEEVAFVAKFLEGDGVPVRQQAAGNGGEIVTAKWGAPDE